MTTELQSLEAPDVDSSTADYATRFAGPAGKYFLEVQTRHVLELTAPWSNARVLDVGGGHGQLAVPLVAAGYNVTVTGSTPECRQLLDEQLGPDAYQFCTCPLLDLPYADKAFDVVFAFRMLPHLRQWPAFLAELSRVARKAVIVDYPEQRSVNRFAQSFFVAKKAFEGNTRPYRCFRYAELAEVFEQRGFTHHDRRPQFFFPMVVHRAMKQPAISRGIEAFASTMGLTRWFGSPVILRAQVADSPSDFDEVEGSS